MGACLKESTRPSDQKAKPTLCNVLQLAPHDLVNPVIHILVFFFFSFFLEKMFSVV